MASYSEVSQQIPFRLYWRNVTDLLGAVSHLKADRSKDITRQIKNGRGRTMDKKVAAVKDADFDKSMQNPWGYF